MGESNSLFQCTTFLASKLTTIKDVEIAESGVSNTILIMCTIANLCASRIMEGVLRSLSYPFSFSIFTSYFSSSELDLSLQICECMVREKVLILVS